MEIVVEYFPKLYSEVFFPYFVNKSTSVRRMKKTRCSIWSFSKLRGTMTSESQQVVRPSFLYQVGMEKGSSDPRWSCGQCLGEVAVQILCLMLPVWEAISLASLLWKRPWILSVTGRLLVWDSPYQQGAKASKIIIQSIPSTA